VTLAVCRLLASQVIVVDLWTESGCVSLVIREMLVVVHHRIAQVSTRSVPCWDLSELHDCDVDRVAHTVLHILVVISVTNFRSNAVDLSIEHFITRTACPTLSLEIVISVVRLIALLGISISEMVLLLISNGLKRSVGLDSYFFNIDRDDAVGTVFLRCVCVCLCV